MPGATPWLPRRTDHSDTPVAGELSSGVEVAVDRGSGVDKAVDAVRPGPGREGGREGGRQGGREGVDY